MRNFSGMIRSLSKGDIDACIRVADDREWVTNHDQWSVLFESGRAYGIEDGADLGGTVVIARYEDLAFVGMMLIRKHLEGRGYGRRLLEFALDDAGVPNAALYATVFGRPLYVKLGFEDGPPLAICRGHFSGAHATSQLVADPRTLAPETIARIVSADARAFGYARPEFIRAMLAIAPRIALIDEGQPSFALTREMDASLHIGPVVADSVESALRLVSALASEAEKECVVYAFQGDRFTQGLAQMGLPQIREIPRMTRGRVRLPNASYYAAGMPGSG